MAALTFQHLPTLNELDTTKNFEQLQAYLNGLAAANTSTTGSPTGPWTTVAFGAKVESNPASQTVQARVDPGGAAIRLRGAAKVKAGEKLEIGETLLTLPAGFRPPEQVYVSTVTNANTATYLSIPASGVLTLPVALNATTVLILDGITFNL